MKLIFLILCFYITISGDNVFAQKHKVCKFITESVNCWTNYIYHKIDIIFYDIEKNYI